MENSQEQTNRWGYSMDNDNLTNLIAFAIGVAAVEIPGYDDPSLTLSTNDMIDILDHRQVVGVWRAVTRRAHVFEGRADSPEAAVLALIHKLIGATDGC